MKGFRNILVHRYGEIYNELAFEAIKNGLSAFETFLYIKKVPQVICSSKS